MAGQGVARCWRVRPARVIPKMAVMWQREPLTATGANLNILYEIPNLLYVFFRQTCQL